MTVCAKISSSVFFQSFPHWWQDSTIFIVMQQHITRKSITTMIVSHSLLMHYRSNLPNLHDSWNMGGKCTKGWFIWLLYPGAYWPRPQYYGPWIVRELKTPWHIIGLSLCEVAVNLWSICRAHQKSWVLYIIGWGRSIPTLTRYLILYEWIKSHSCSYWTAEHRLMGFMAHFRDWSLDGRWNIPAHLLHPQQSIYHPHKLLYAVSSLWMVKESTERKTKSSLFEKFLQLCDYILKLGVWFFLSRDNCHSECFVATCHIFVVHCKTQDTHKPKDYINNSLFRMLNFQRNPYKSLITFDNSGDDCFFSHTTSCWCKGWG